MDLGPSLGTLLGTLEWRNAKPVVRAHSVGTQSSRSTPIRSHSVQVSTILLTLVCRIQEAVEEVRDMVPAKVQTSVKPGLRVHRWHMRIDRNVIAHREHIAVLRRSEEHTSELQSLRHLVCRLLLEK